MYTAARETKPVNSGSIFPTREASWSSRASRLAISSNPCGTPAFTNSTHIIEKPRTTVSATTKLSTRVTFKTVHGSIFLIILLTLFTRTIINF